jgi:hypothetical protein
MLPHQDSISVQVSSSPQRLGILIQGFCVHIPPVSITNLASYNRNCVLGVGVEGSALLLDMRSRSRSSTAGMSTFVGE